MLDSLKPCPFCGGAATAHDDTADSPMWIAGCCSAACALQPSVYGETKADVVAAWNRRALPAPAAGEPELPTVAWRDDGATRSGSTSTAFRVVTDETRRDMPGAAKEAFTDALVRRVDAIAMAEHARGVAMEDAAKVCEAQLETGAHIRCASAIRAAGDLR